MLRLLLQYARFGTVGIVAAITHVSLFAALIEVAGLAPLSANVVAFTIALLISFFGHFHWTFRPSRRASRLRRPAPDALPKFVIVALVGLGLNSLVVYVVTGMLVLPYFYAIVLMVSVVPCLIFALHKFWSFA